MMKNLKLPIPLFLAGVLIMGVFVGVHYFKERAAYMRGKNVVYPAGQVLGVETATTDLSADFSQMINTGRPGVFGAAHGPSLSHPQAWSMLKDMGVTTLRRDINLQYEAPLSASLPLYILNNIGNTSTSNFNLTRITETREIFRHGRINGMKTIGVTAFMPTWLSVNGKNNGLPANWEIYEDIVYKVYKLHRPYLDYLEISNEPDLTTFLDPAGTELSRQDAYLELFLHTARAVRKADQDINDGRKMKIGGGITSYPYQPSYLEALLKNEEARNYIDFVSYHSYGHTEPTSKHTKDVLKKYEKDVPIFVTEWNKSSSTEEYSPYHRGNMAITYTAEKLMDYLIEGYGAANYFTMSSSDPNRPNTVFSVFGIYQMKGDRVVPFDQAKTWMVLSKMSKLGRGDSTIYRTSYDTSTSLKAMAFKNVDGKYGLAINNPTSKSFTVNVSLQNIEFTEQSKIVAYEASLNWDAKLPKGTLTGIPENSQVKVFVSPMSLVSLIVE